MKQSHQEVSYWPLRGRSGGDVNGDGGGSEGENQGALHGQAYHKSSALVLDR